jgi:hypothetical protein
MSHHHDFNFYYGKHPELTNDQRASSLIEMQKQIQSLQPEFDTDPFISSSVIDKFLPAPLETEEKKKKSEKKK